MAAHKPGEIITPASFAVAPELLGKPLAKPMRRALAMAIDLVLLAVLVKGGGVFFGLAAAFALWRASARTGLASTRPKLRRRLRFAAAALLFLIVVGNWGMVTRPFHRLTSGSGADAGDDEPDGTQVVAQPQKAGAMQGALIGFSIAREAAGLKKARNEAEARRMATKLVRGLKQSGMPERDLQQAVRELAGDKDQPLPPVAVKALQDAVGKTASPDSAATSSRPDSLASAYLRAAAKGDSDALEQLQPRLAAAFAGDSLEELSTAVGKLRAQNKKLEDRIQADSARNAGKAVGLMDTFANAGDEIVRLLKKAGLGFGWTGLYFTAFVALMRGQTPGKRLLRLRIVRLDGRPMGWWSAIERFGGYAASIVTGLSGFFQILWDKNRQAMHDKIAETVVVQE